ncbi:MAG: hypothetical protein M1826_007441 [Phylliscum demangeonii]|nr:MAG: hypothetical protein M1826_007441 [Phylliscum demangeonii]
MTMMKKPGALRAKRLAAAMRAYERRKADAAAAGRTFREREPVLPPAHRSKPGISALREIRHWQKTSGLTLAKGPFRRVVKEVASMSPRAHPDLRFMASAVDALQEAAEQYLVSTFEVANLATMHAGRQTVMPKDFALVRDVTKDRNDWAMMGGNWFEERKAQNRDRDEPPPAKKAKKARKTTAKKGPKPMPKQKITLHVPSDFSESNSESEHDEREERNRHGKSVARRWEAAWRDTVAPASGKRKATAAPAKRATKRARKYERYAGAGYESHVLPVQSSLARCAILALRGDLRQLRWPPFTGRAGCLEGRVGRNEGGVGSNEERAERGEDEPGTSDLETINASLELAPTFIRFGQHLHLVRRRQGAGGKRPRGSQEYGRSSIPFDVRFLRNFKREIMGYKGRDGIHEDNVHIHRVERSISTSNTTSFETKW